MVKRLVVVTPQYLRKSMHFFSRQKLRKGSGVWVLLGWVQAAPNMTPYKTALNSLIKGA